jgi:anti-sigma regulatory factor (Ser/Thr protein kinase)
MRIVISSEPRLLYVLRGVVRYRAQMAGFGQSEVDHMTLAIDEAAANVIRHAYKDRRDGRLALEILTLSDRMEFILEDSAPKVQPETIRSRSLDDIRPGGLGTYFINSCMDKCTFDERFTEGNRLIMVKFLPRKVPTNNESTSQKH